MIYLGLGSNQGDRQKNMEKALALIAERVGVILALSDFYETPPWGYESSNTYLNAAVEVDTPLSPKELLLVTQEIERAVGRTQKTLDGHYRDRPMDIDILGYDQLVLQTPELTLPHPLMHQRKFVLQPLLQIAPAWIHPVLGKSISEIFAKLERLSTNEQQFAVFGQGPHFVVDG